MIRAALSCAITGRDTVMVHARASGATTADSDLSMAWARNGLT